MSSEPRAAFTGALLSSLFWMTTADAGPLSIALPGTRAFPESITSTSDGTLFIGRLGEGGVVRANPPDRSGRALRCAWRIRLAVDHRRVCRRRLRDPLGLLAAAKSRLQRKRVMFTGSQRLTIALLTRWMASWRATVTLVQPATVLRWHREGFRLLWRWRSRTRGRRPTRYATLIREMTARNPRWGAERLRGELLKLGIRLSKRTVQRYMKKRVTGDGQRWV